MHFAAFVIWARSSLAATQRVELRPRAESRHCTNRDDPAFSPASRDAPTFGLRKLSFAKLGLTDGSEPTAEVPVFCCARMQREKSRKRIMFTAAVQWRDQSFLQAV
jgi:hypothetical protein